MVPEMANSVANKAEQTLVLEEYRQALQYLRHGDQQAWTIIGLSSTLALSLCAYALKGVPIWSLQSLLGTLVGALTLILGRLMAWRITAHTESRKQRAVKLEEILGFELVTKLHERMTGTCSFSVNCTLHVIALAAGIGWIVHLVAFLDYRMNGIVKQGDAIMNKYIWLAFTAIFLVFAVYHLCRATKSLPKPPNTAEAKSINGLNLGIHEFIEGFNLYIDGVNKDARIANVITGLAHLMAAVIALLSYFVAS